MRKKKEKKDVVKSEKKINKKQGYFHKLKEEMKKVKWPSAKEIFKYTIATIVLVVIISLVFQGLDALVSLVKGLFS